MEFRPCDVETITFHGALSRHGTIVSIGRVQEQAGSRFGGTVGEHLSGRAGERISA
jgi:hypothetical protein